MVQGVHIPGLPPLHWENRPGRASVEQGTLCILAPHNTDWVVSPLDLSATHNAPALGFSAPDHTFSLSARVSVQTWQRTTFDAPVLVVWRDPQHYAKLCFEQSPTGDVGPVSVVTDGGPSDDANAYTVDGDHMWLRVSRVGEDAAAWAFHASVDGKWWDFVRVFRLGGEGELNVGFLAQCPTGTGCAAVFDEIVLGDAPTNLRDGS